MPFIFAWIFEMFANNIFTRMGLTLIWRMKNEMNIIRKHFFSYSTPLTNFCKKKMKFGFCKLADICVVYNSSNVWSKLKVGEKSTPFPRILSSSNAYDVYIYEGFQSLTIQKWRHRTEIMNEANSKISVLSMGSSLNFGFWNVCTMYETGTQTQVLLEIKQSRLPILEICECFRKSATGRPHDHKLTKI